LNPLESYESSYITEKKPSINDELNN
jgi:hypothetical protein